MFVRDRLPFQILSAPCPPAHPYRAGGLTRFIEGDTAAFFRLDIAMDAVEDIKSRLDVADVVGEYVQLKTAGSGSFKAVCPFHQEKTPSFYVSRPRQTWHCFGCDQGGDLISFVMKMEGMEFREALELLAQKAGVELPAFDGKASSMKKRLHEVNELAMRFFRAALHSLPQAEQARAYVKKRGLDDLTVDLFQIGYAPDSWDALTTALSAKGVTSDELLQAGLSAKREKATGVYDRFRNRLMFPIADVHSNIVGFTGRILSDDKKEAKYVNTPETSVYRKSNVLYGLDKAKGDIRRQDLAVVVEGNMDVVGSHQFGVTHVVAASGTALTAEQLALLKRFTTNLAIAFDQDNAGAAATLRGLDLARNQDFNIKIITLPPEAGKDPDEAVRKDPDLWREAIKQAVGIMDWVYRNAFRNRNPSRPEDKKLIARDVLTEIRRIADPVERDHWMKKLAHDLDTSDAALLEAMQRLKAEPARNVATPEIKGSPSSELSSEAKNNDTQGTPLEERVLASAIARPGLFDSLAEFGLVEADFSDSNLQTLYASIIRAYSGLEISTNRSDIVSGQPIRPPASLMPDQATRFDALAFLAEREFQGMTSEEIRRELKTGVEKLQLLRKARERELLEQEMRMAERLGDQTKIAELLRRFETLK